MKYFRQYGGRAIIGVLLAAALAYTACRHVYAVETGTITELAAHVYEDADTGSNIVANVIMGYNFPILAEKTDEGGNAWYLIETDTGVQGYIPAQGVIRLGAETHEGDAQAGNAQAQEPAIENEDENNLPDSVRKQLLTMQAVNIRENPSTAGEILGQIPSGIMLDYMDVITNPMGEVWYEISYEDVRGFIRQSTVTEIEMPIQEDGMQPGLAGMQPENIDIDMLMEIAKQYQDEGTGRESVAEPEALAEPQAQIIYDSDSVTGESAEGTKKKRAAFRPDMVILFSLLGIILCAAVIGRTYKKLVRLYR